MDEPALRRLLEEVQRGSVSANEAVRRLRRLPFADLGFARVDHHRPLRLGLAEAVYGPGKTPEQCAAVVAELLSEEGGPVLLTRADEAQVKAACARNPGGTLRTTTVAWRPLPTRGAHVIVVTAGTADLPVAEECATALWAYGLEPVLQPDVGVSGLHRLVDSMENLAQA
jgi:NCAIR mutase (PurE)-related protein